MSKLDVEKLRQEIENKKKQSEEKRSILGEKVRVPVKGDVFLHELMQSASSGRMNAASAKVKAVAEGSDIIAEAKSKGTKVDPSLMEHIVKKAEARAKNSEPLPNRPQAPQRQPQAPVNNGGMMEEREPPIGTVSTSNSSLYEAINTYSGNMNSSYNNPTPNRLLTEAEAMEEMRRKGMLSGNAQYPAGSQISSLNEQVVSQISNMLNENFGELYGKAMKNHIIESYKKDIIKKAITENKDVIRDIVVEVILELQKKGKSSR